MVSTPTWLVAQSLCMPIRGSAIRFTSCKLASQLILSKLHCNSQLQQRFICVCVWAANILVVLDHFAWVVHVIPSPWSGPFFRPGG